VDIAVTGSHGLIGAALIRSLEADGHHVRRVVRSNAGPGDVAWDIDAGAIDAAALAGVEAVVHLAGEGIGAHRWTDEQKRRILESRSKGTALLAGALAAMTPPPSVLVSASAVGFYGDRGDEILTEDSGSGTGFLVEVCQAWEGATAVAANAGIRVAISRMGIVLDAKGGALAKLLPLFKLGLGGRMGSGRQWWSWIAIDDAVGALRWLLDHDVHGAANLTSPEPVTNATFAKALGRALHRPSFLPTPKLGPALVVGREAAAELFGSQRAVPATLQSAGYQFHYPMLDPALAAVVQ
jgi:hypothetical protein